MKYRQLFLMLALILTSLATQPRAQADDALAPVIFSSGLLETDGTVIYSVIMASSTEDLGNLRIVAQLPADTSFIANLDIPAAATYLGAQNGEVTWRVDSLPANSILGPFTFQAQPSAENAAPPVTIPARMTWQTPRSGSAEAPLSDAPIVAFEDSGELLIDPAGTLNEAGENIYVPVGNSGVWLMILPETVSEPTTLTVTRFPVTDDNVPANIANTWWCAMFAFETTPAVAFNRPIGAIIPTRRMLTPGLPVHLFAPVAEGEYALTQEATSDTPGNVCTSMGMGIVCTLVTTSTQVDVSGGAGISGLASADIGPASSGRSAGQSGQPLQGFQGGFQSTQFGGIQFGGQFGGSFQGGIQFGQGGFQGGQFGGQFGQGGFQTGQIGGGGFGGAGAGLGVDEQARDAGFVSSERLAQLGVTSAVQLLQLFFSASSAEVD